jgi:hypothetical protein
MSNSAKIRPAYRTNLKALVSSDKYPLKVIATGHSEAPPPLLHNTLRVYKHH